MRGPAMFLRSLPLLGWGEGCAALDAHDHGSLLPPTPTSLHAHTLTHAFASATTMTLPRHYFNALLYARRMAGEESTKDLW